VATCVLLAGCGAYRVVFFCANLQSAGSRPLAAPLVASPRYFISFRSRDRVKVPYQFGVLHVEQSCARERLSCRIPVFSWNHVCDSLKIRYFFLCLFFYSICFALLNILYFILFYQVLRCAIYFTFSLRPCRPNRKRITPLCHILGKERPD